MGVEVAQGQLVKAANQLPAGMAGPELRQLIPVLLLLMRAAVVVVAETIKPVAALVAQAVAATVEVHQVTRRQQLPTRGAEVAVAGLMDQLPALINPVGQAALAS